MSKYVTKPRFSKITGIFIEFPGARARCGYCNKIINVTDRLMFYRTVVVHITCLLDRWKKRLKTNKHNRTVYESYIQQFKNPGGSKLYDPITISKYTISYEKCIENCDKMIAKWADQITSLMNFIKNDSELSTELTSSMLEEGK